MQFPGNAVQKRGNNSVQKEVTTNLENFIRANLYQIALEILQSPVPLNDIHEKISAPWLAESRSINPKQSAEKWQKYM